MQYGKLLNGHLKLAPKRVVYEDKTVCNPSVKKLVELGYFPINYTNEPIDTPTGQHYEYSWMQNESDITQVWILVNDSEDLTSEEFFDMVKAVL